jgi:hypothetical protein
LDLQVYAACNLPKPLRLSAEIRQSNKYISLKWERGVAMKVSRVDTLIPIAAISKGN